VREHVIPLNRLQYRFPTKQGELVMKTTSFWHSIRCALSGMRYVWRPGRNAKIEVVIAIAVVIDIGLFVLGPPLLERLKLV
jgi:diacylglycerol kinase